MKTFILITEASQVVLVVKNLPANAADMKDVGLISGWGRSPGGSDGNPLQYSCLKNSMDRGAWQATMHRVAKHQTRLEQQSTHTRINNRKSERRSDPGLVQTKYGSVSLQLFKGWLYYQADFLCLFLCPMPYFLCLCL